VQLHIHHICVHCKKERHHHAYGVTGMTGVTYQPEKNKHISVDKIKTEYQL
jgi:hypothetical protein